MQAGSLKPVEDEKYARHCRGIPYNLLGIAPNSMLIAVAMVAGWLRARRNQAGCK